MKYVVTGSLGNVSRSLAVSLVDAGHDVTVITSSAAKTHEIELIGAKAAVGSVIDADFLTRAFTGADAVYTMVPPNLNVSDWKGHIRSIGKNYATAIKASGVTHVVNLSSIGAHMPEGCGPVSGLYYVEQELNSLEGVNVRHLRPGFFYYNLLANVGMIKHMGIMGGNYGENALMTMVSPADIATAAAEEMQNATYVGKSIRYVVSDELHTNEIAAILGKAIGKPGTPWINFKNEDTYKGMLQAGLSEEIAKNYVEMGAAMASGEMGREYVNNKPEFSSTKFAAFVPLFVAAYQGN